MRKWFELGWKIGCIELSAKLCSLPNMLISPHDIENVHYEILEYMDEMMLDSSKIADSKIEEYERIALEQIKSPNKAIKRQLFLLGFYVVKLKMLMLNDLDNICDERRRELYEYICSIIDTLNLPESLKKISLEECKETEFDRIEEAVKNNPSFDVDESVSRPNKRQNKTRIEVIVAIIVALIAAAATIIAAIISKA